MPYKAREVLAKLKRAGFEQKPQSVSHIILRHLDWETNLCRHAH